MMHSIQRRILHNPYVFRRYISTNEILKIKEILEKPDNQNSSVHNKKSTIALSKKIQSQPSRKLKDIDDGPIIMKELSKLTPINLKWKATHKEYTSIASFLTLAKIGLEWSIYDYKKLLEIQNTSNYRELPEIIFLGRCNVGKSSLINMLLSKKKQKEVECYAKVKQQAGYTPCLNFYNIGGKFRLVDTPGYGVKGREWQGKLVFEYLQKRENLQNTYLILDAEVGLNQYDELIIQNLFDLGIKFDIIFNKIDKIPKPERTEKILELVNNGIIGQLNMKPRCYAVSCNETFRSGITEVMVSALESCELIKDGETKNLIPAKKKCKVRAEVIKNRYKQGKKEHKEQQRREREKEKEK